MLLAQPRTCAGTGRLESTVAETATNNAIERAHEVASLTGAFEKRYAPHLSIVSTEGC